MLTSILETLAQTTRITTTTNTDAGASAAALLFQLVFSLAYYIFIAVCLQKIFQKAGREDSWAAWVPFYNFWVLFEIAGKPGWWSIIWLVPFVGALILFVFMIIANIELSERFGKGGGFAALLILLPIVGYPMLAFGDAQYNGGTSNGSMPQNPQTPQAPVQ